MLEHLVWSIYDGILTLGPTPKLVGPESYNQVLKRLTTKAYRGLQVHCSARTSAQFDEPPLQGAISCPHATPAQGSKESWNHGHHLPERWRYWRRGHGGAINIDPDKYTLAWMCDCQCGYADEQIEFWPLLHPLMDGSEVKTQQLACRLLSMWHWSSATHPTSCPPTPTNMEIRMVVTIEPRPREGETGFVDRSICVLFAVHSGGCYWMIMDFRRRGDGPTNQPPCLHVSGGH